jgi:hypothetical protein
MPVEFYAFLLDKLNEIEILKVNLVIILGSNDVLFFSQSCRRYIKKQFTISPNRHIIFESVKMEK